MQHIYKKIALVATILGALLIPAAFALAVASVTVLGGTGTSSPSGILYGDNGATSHLNTVKIGANCTFTGGTFNCSGGGGSGSVGTSTADVANQVTFFTTNSATPALIAGNSAFTFNSTAGRLTVTYASTTAITAATFFGALTGNASTATALAANGTNCSAGSYALGVDASGNAEGCTVANLGTVTGVTGTWPIISSGGTTPNITWGGIATSSAISAASGMLYATGVNTFASISTSSPVNMSITGNAGTVTNGVYTSGAGTVYLTPTGSAASLTSFPTFNQNTTGSAGSVVNALTFNNSGSGASSGTTFTGASAQTISYNTIGAQVAGTYDTFGYPFPSNATTSSLTFGGVTITGASTGCATFTSGVLSSTGTACGSGGGSTFAFPWTPTTNFGINTNATSTPISFFQGIFASSTSVIASTTFAINGSVGIGTTSPWARLSVDTSNLGATTQEFAVGSSIRTDFFINQNGQAAFGTTSVNGADTVDVENTFSVLNANPGGGATSQVLNSNGVGGFFRAYGPSFAVASLANNVAFGPQGAGQIIVFSNASTGSGGSGSISLRGGGYDTPAEDLLLDKNGSYFTHNNVGVGTTSPFAKLSVQANNGDTNRYLFAIGSSTASATTTLFSVLNNGTINTSLATGFVQSTAGALSSAALTSSNITTALGFTPISGNQTITLSGVVTGSGATAITTAFGSQTAGVLGAVTTANTSVLATSTLYGAVQNSKVLAGVNGVLAYVATTTASCSAGITCSYSGGANNFSIAGNALTLSMLPTIGANTVIGNLTGGTATPTAFATSSLFTGTTGQAAWFSGSGLLTGTSSLLFTSATSTFASDVLIQKTSPNAFQINDNFSTPDFLFNTASTTGSIFTVAATTSPNLGTGIIKLFDVDQYGHLTASSTPATPTISSCGSGSPAMGTNANDDTGTFVTGTSASSCTITFGRAYATTPVVVVSDSNTTAVVDISAVSTTAFTVSMASALSAVTVYYIVVQP